MECELQEGIVMDSYPGPLGQMLTNFVTNALAHAFDGRSAGTMRLTCVRHDIMHVEIRFSDDGKGIAEENLNRVFDPFFTTKLGQGGSGLGLNIVYNIVTSVLGGTIALESELGRGTTFIVILPLKAPVIAAGNSM
jgi:signal transduction histidine kinase